jgi:hypothetical protein
MRVLGASAVLALAGLSSVLGFAQERSSTPPVAPSRADYEASYYAGGNGLSRKTAVVLKICSDVGGIGSEYAWVAHTYPGSKVTKQALMAWDDGRRFDVLTVETTNAVRLRIWFDITCMYK